MMKIGVLMGGLSSEREVSLASGNEIMNHLYKEKYEVFPLVIDSKEEVVAKVQGMDFVFIALHGEFGEDGSIQAILDSIEMAYSGCGVLTSAICMSKKQTKRILKAEDIAVPGGFIVYRDEKLDVTALETIGYPMVVKPNNGGSSIGTFLVKNREQLVDGIEEALRYDTQVLVEQYVRGSEYTVPLLGGEVLPILEIIPTGEFFDFQSKYEDGGAEEIVATLPAVLEAEMNAIAKECWKIFDCSVYVRVDMIVSEGKPYVLELNTLPGMTKNSLFPRSAKAVGMHYSELLEKVIHYSLNKG